MSSEKREKRSEMAIIRDMLTSAREGARKTRIMYSCNLSYLLLQKYLDKLMKAGLLEISRDTGLYQCTEKGGQFLKEYYELEKSLRTLYEKKKNLETLASRK